MPKTNRSAYDWVLKDLFQMDRPSLLTQWTGGVPVREFAKVDFQRIIERRADLVAVLENGHVFHLEFQAQNDNQLPYRVGIYGLLISQKYQCRVSQVVLYVGGPKMRMKSELDTGGAKISFRLIDIRDIDAEILLQSGSAGDLVLAMLAKGGAERLGEIAGRIAGLKYKERVRVLTQLILLSGLRKLTGRLRMELGAMGSLQIDIRKNEILRDVWEEVMAEGLAKGEARGEARGEAKGELIGKRKALHGFLHDKFGHVPKWAEQRMSKANRAQVERWLNKVVAAQTLEGIIGKR